MYDKAFTEKVLELEAHGLTALETVDYLRVHGYPRVGINTVYRHRKGPLSDEITVETVRQQRRSILKQDADNPALAMKYRNELLKLLIPQRIESYSESYHKQETQVKVDVEGLLKQYEDLFEEAALLENCAPEPLHPPPAHRKTGAVPPPR